MYDELDSTPAAITERRTKWLAALRSGVYRQGTGELGFRTSTRGVMEYCCLGVAVVACELEHNWTRAVMFIPANSPDMPPLQGHLNSDYRDALGISAETMDRLITMNDTERRSFNEIANFLENLFSEEERP